MEPKSLTLPFFHALSGCDIESSFHGKGTCSPWQTWQVFEKATPIFTRLGATPTAVNDEDLDVIEEFVVFMYDSTSCMRVNEARLDLFARKERSYDCIPCQVLL